MDNDLRLDDQTYARSTRSIPKKVSDTTLTGYLISWGVAKDAGQARWILIAILVMLLAVFSISIKSTLPTADDGPGPLPNTYERI